MRLKSCALAVLCFATVTACAHPMEQTFEARSATRLRSLESSGLISRGACDDVGQFIPGKSAALTAEASAAPTR